MGAIANIVAFDGASTPASHTFVPQSVTRDGNTVTARWKEVVSSVPDAAQGTIQMVLEQLPANKQTGLQMYKVTNRVEIPVMEAISGQNAAGYTAAPKVAYVNRVDTIGYFSTRSTENERRLIRQLAINIDGSISTSVTPVTTGPLPELFEKLVMPT